MTSTSHSRFHITHFLLSVVSRISVLAHPREDIRSGSQINSQHMYGTTDKELCDIEMRCIQEGVDITADLYGSIVNKSKNFFGISFAVKIEYFEGKIRKCNLTTIFVASEQQLVGAIFFTSYASYSFALINIRISFMVACVLYIVMIIAICMVFSLVEVVGCWTLSLWPLRIALLIVGGIGFLSDWTTADCMIVVTIHIRAITYQ